MNGESIKTVEILPRYIGFFRDLPSSSAHFDRGISEDWLDLFWFSYFVFQNCDIDRGSVEIWLIIGDILQKMVRLFSCYLFLSQNSRWIFFQTKEVTWLIKLNIKAVYCQITQKLIKQEYIKNIIFESLQIMYLIFLPKI